MSNGKKGLAFILALTLVLSGVRSFTPIGAPSGFDFAGTLDGAGHKVSGVYCNRTAASTGFIGRLAGELKNIRIENSYIFSTKGNVGVVGSTTGSMDSIYSDAIIKANDAHVGGIVGGDYNTNWSLTRCLVTGTISGRTTTGIATLFGYPEASVRTHWFPERLAESQ